MEIANLSVCLPVYYGAKIKDVERCLDSLYSMCENIDKKYKDKNINFLIGIDNSPKKFSNDKSVQKNKIEIKNRILIFKEAIEKLDNRYKVNYFITENNVRVSVMRNIMISKTQNSEFITFIDHDDQMKLEALNIIFKAINENPNKNIIYFKCTDTWIKTEQVFEIFGPWSILYNPKFLLKNNIAFIPDIPLEDRFFRREAELYLIREEREDLEESFYMHNKEGRSGLLETDLLALIRQEVFKRIFYKNLKVKTYCTLKNDLDEFSYGEYVYTFNEKNKGSDFLYNDVLNCNRFIESDFAFSDGKRLNKYEKENHFTLCKIIFNENQEEIYSRGYLTNKPLVNIVDFNKINNFIRFLEYKSENLIVILKYIDKIIDNNEFTTELNSVSKENAEELLNKLVKYREKYIKKLIENKKYNELEQILNIQDKDIDLSFIDYEKINDDKIKEILNNYLFYKAYNAVINENLALIQDILKKYPDIINITNSTNKVNLSNLACRRQSIQDTEIKTIILKIRDENNKIIAFLLKNFPESFKVKDIFGKTAFDFLLVDYPDNLKFNNNISEIPNDFFEKITKLEEIFGDDFYTMIPNLRFIYNTNIVLDTKSNILKKIKEIKKEYIGNKLIGFNIIEAYKNNNYSILINTLIENKAKNGIDVLLPNYIKYTTLENIFNYKDKNNKTILDYAKDDKKFNDFIRNFLIKTIWINFDKNVVIDPVDSYNIARTKQAINILYDKSNHFDDYEIDFKKFLDEFFKKSKILSTAKVAQELFDKIKVNKNILEKKEQKKFEKVNTKNVEKLPNFDKIKELFKEIEIINSSNDNNLNKTKRFLDLIEKSDYTKK